MTTRALPASLLGLALALASCNRSGAEPAPGAAANTDAAKIARIVFVGKQEACDCTRAAIDASWAALEQALGTPARLPVEQLQNDTEGDKVAPYREQQAIMALPAIYFVDRGGRVLAQLQGEVTEQQIRAVLE
jgi:hypothetical protein